MSAHFRIDRESFQKLLANAFALQESGIGTELLSALLKLDRLVATDEPDLNQTTHQLTDLAREVANASGTAIALLHGDQLTYRAGSGCAATYVGSNRTAILNAAAHNQPRSEILRVENALTDARIEAAICREFGANALLILPIYREGTIHGVLEILFDEPHAFQHRELLAYRLMVGLLEEAMARGAQLAQEKALRAEPASVPASIDRIASQVSKFYADQRPTPRREHRTAQVCAAAIGSTNGVPPDHQVARTATTITLRIERTALAQLRWSVATTAVIGALVMASWIAYSHRVVSRGPDSQIQRSITAGQRATPVPATATPATALVIRKVASFAPRRAGIRRARMDEIADDVTVRHFTPQPAVPPKSHEEKQVSLGEDVTVRYFASKPADLQQR